MSYVMLSEGNQTKEESVKPMLGNLFAHEFSSL